MDWIARVNGVEYHTPSIDDLRAWRTDGRITDETLIFHPLLQRWLPARDVAELRLRDVQVRSDSTGCGARGIDLLVGTAVGWSCAAYFGGRFAKPPSANTRAEIYGLVLGALAGVLLPEIVRVLERARVPRDASRTAFSLIAAALLGAAYGKVFENGCIRGMLTLSFAACVLFFLDAVVGRSAGVITPLARGARNELGKLLLKATAGALIGATGGLLRMYLKVVAVTAAADVELFLWLMLLTGALSYPALLLLVRGRQAVRRAKVIVPLLDGLLYALLIALPMTSSTPSLTPFWSETINRENWVWIPLGMFLGVSMTVIVGGVQSILLLLIRNPAVQFASGVVVDGISELLGRPRRATPGVVDGPLTPNQRTLSGCIGAVSFVGILCFGLMALCFGGGEGVFSQDDKDLARLPVAGCPPSCARVDFSGWSLARTDRFRGANFDGADLQGTALWSADLSGASFRDARMQHVKLMHARLPAADLTGADLRGADLTGAQFQRAILRHANLDGALLQSADLSEAKLENAKLAGAVFDAATVWPATVDPRAAGARMDGE